MSARVEILLSVIMRGWSYLLFALLIPKYVEYFNGDLEASGKWFVAVSTCNWLLAIDFGIGNSLRNKLIKLKARNQDTSIPTVIISGVLVNAFIAFLIYFISIILIKTLGYTGNLDDEWIKGLDILIISICIQFFVRIVVFIHYANQKTYINSFFNLITNLLLYGAFEFKVIQSSNVINLSSLYGFAINVPIVLSGVYMLAVVVFRKKIVLLKKLNAIRLRNTIAYLAKGGGSFFANQLLYVAIIQINPIIILKISGAENVVQYTALSTIFFVPIILMNLVGNSIWSRVTRSLGKGDPDWAGNALDKLIKFGLIIIACTAGVALTYNHFTKYWWSGTKSFQVEQITIAIFFIYTSALIMQTALSNFACAIQRLSLQRNFYIIILVFKIIFFFGFEYFTSINWPLILVSDSVILITYCVFQKYQIVNELKKYIVVRASV